MRYTLIRDVTREECSWLDMDLKAGDEVQSFDGYTYGCIGPDGVACTFGGDHPFFELPRNAIRGG